MDSEQPLNQPLASVPAASSPAALDWSPASWRKRTANQQPVYDDQQRLAGIVERLCTLPPLVTSWEIHSLREQLAAASRGDAFILQGGDCSESLDDCSTESVVRNLKVLMQMSFVLTYGTKKRIVRIGRVAGQYAKPRSKDTETRDGVTLPVYRGDIINRSGFTESERRPDPELLLRGYERAALTLNFIRALSAGGFADLHHPENWEVEFARESARGKQYHRLVESITNSLQFMEKVLGTEIMSGKSVEFFTSHEALHLVYEQAQTRTVPRRDGWYNLSTHFPWIGNRTRQLDGAHIEYFRGIENPIGVKVGVDIEASELVRLTEILNPENLPGRLTLIHRMGHDKIARSLPSLVGAVQKAKRNVLWICDPMHGNTFATPDGVKTRDFNSIVNELNQAFAIHETCGSRLGGVHLELTGDNVTECVGGSKNLQSSDLHRAYKSAVDPRLNYDQAMEIAFLIAERVSGIEQ